MLFWLLIGLATVMLLGGFALRSEDLRGTAVVLGILTVPICFIVTNIASGDGEPYPVKDERTLVAVRDSEEEQSHFSGGFFLFVGGASGGSSTELEYAWYERDEETGAIHPHTGVRSDRDTHIELYDDLEKGESPYVVKRTEHGGKSGSTPGWVSPFGLNVGGGSADRDETWELHVPDEAILRDFELNLQ